MSNCSVAGSRTSWSQGDLGSDSWHRHSSQISVRVKQLGDRITMWSLSDVDTKNIFWRLWNQATGFMSATICSVLEAPVTPWFLEGVWRRRIFGRCALQFDADFGTPMERLS